MSASSSSPEVPTGPSQLNGWKEIAAYLGRSVRTVQRWEKDFGLPVRRFGQSRPESVFAITREIDVWLLTSQGVNARSGAGAQEPAGGLTARVIRRRRRCSRAGGSSEWGWSRLPRWSSCCCCGPRGAHGSQAEGTRRLPRRRQAANRPTGRLISTRSSCLMQTGTCCGSTRSRASCTRNITRARHGHRARCSAAFRTSTETAAAKCGSSPSPSAGRPTAPCICSSATAACAGPTSRRGTFVSGPRRSARRGWSTGPSSLPTRQARPRRAIWAVLYDSALFPSSIQRLDPGTGSPLSEYWTNGSIVTAALDASASPPRLLVGACYNETRAGSLSVLDALNPDGFRTGGDGEVPVHVVPARGADGVPGLPQAGPVRQGRLDRPGGNADAAGRRDTRRARALCLVGRRTPLPSVCSGSTRRSRPSRPTRPTTTSRCTTSWSRAETPRPARPRRWIPFASSSPSCAGTAPPGAIEGVPAR